MYIYIYIYTPFNDDEINYGRMFLPKQCSWEGADIVRMLVARLKSISNRKPLTFPSFSRSMADTTNYIPIERPVYKRRTKVSQYPSCTLYRIWIFKWNNKITNKRSNFSKQKRRTRLSTCEELKADRSSQSPCPGLVNGPARDVQRTNIILQVRWPGIGLHNPNEKF